MSRVVDGTIVSIGGPTSIVVGVTQMKMHRLYRKQYKSSTKIAAHCTDSSKLSVGQKIRVVETRPISKTKRFKVVEEAK